MKNISELYQINLSVNKIVRNHSLAQWDQKREIKQLIDAHRQKTLISIKRLCKITEDEIV